MDQLGLAASGAPKANWQGKQLSSHSALTAQPFKSQRKFIFNLPGGGRFFVLHRLDQSGQRFMLNTQLEHFTTWFL